jgi:hypothetical protein
MRSRLFRVTCLPAIAVVGAIGFAATASVAWAQPQAQPHHAAKAKAAAPASKDTDVSGVVVQAPRKPDAIPPHKRAAFDAEAAKQKAWQDYRSAPPTATATASARPGHSPKTGNYPGLHSLTSH